MFLCTIIQTMIRRASGGHGRRLAYASTCRQHLNNSVTGEFTRHKSFSRSLSLPPLSRCQAATSTFRGTAELNAASILAYCLVVASITQHKKNPATQMEYWDHNPKDFDYYITKSQMSKDHLPILLHKFDHENLDVWPWIWTHPNNDGPHHVYIGINHDILDDIEKLCSGENSEQINILIVASEGALRKVAMERKQKSCRADKKRDSEHSDDDDKDDDCMNIYCRYQCGLVIDSQLELLNEDAKILMLNDERVVAYDFITIL